MKTKQIWVTSIVLLLSFFVLGAGARQWYDSLILDTYMDIKGSAAPAVSAAGQARLYVDSTTNSVKLSQNGNAYSNLTSGTTLGRNKLMNGDFNIWQRGTSFASMSTTQYTADRWKFWVHGSPG